MPEQQQDILITIIVASVFFVLLGIFLLVLLFVFLRRQRKNEKEKEEMRNHFEKTLLKSQIEIQDQTIDYVAKEIHDNIGQILFLAKLNNNQITRENALEKANLIDDLIGRAFNDLRSISHNLKNNSFHQIGLTESIEQLLHNLERTGKFTTSFSCPPSDEIDGMIHGNDIILFRIIQEVVNNILKHSGANRIDIQITKDQKTISIEIMDNGIGFNADIARNENQGIGMKNIYSRAKLINTNVNIISATGEGTKVILTLKTQ
ncbi:MAG: ATP-binding protein [Sediminibacterium sp.]|nr:ATP-binding protein [Sediminibacterium sp.]